MEIEEIAKTVSELNERFTDEDELGYPPFSCCLNGVASSIMFHDWVVWSNADEIQNLDGMPLVDWVWKAAKDLVSDWMNTLEMGEE